MEFNIQTLFSENHLRAYFTKFVGWLSGLDFDQGVFECCVTETKSRFIKRKQKELQTLLHVTPWVILFTVLRSLGRQSVGLTNDYITYVSTVRRKRQQLWFYPRRKDHGPVPARLKLKSPLNTQEAIPIVKATCRRLVKAWINDCHRRLKRYRNKTQQLHDKLKQLIPTELLDIVTTTANKRDNKPPERARTGHQQKLTRLLRNKEQKRNKPDDNWVRNISSRPLDKNKTRVLSYGLKHSVTPKRIPTEAVASSVEAALCRQQEPSESTEDSIGSRIAPTTQSASHNGSNLTTCP